MKMNVYRRLGLSSAVLLAACNAGEATAPGSKHLQVVNYLLSPVSIKIDGASERTVSSGTPFGPADVRITVPGSASSLNYAVSARRYADGSAIADDLSGETVAVSSDDVTLSITNVVRGRTYFFPVTQGSELADARSRYGTDTASFDIGSATGRHCIGYVRGNGAIGLWGYYLLEPGTTVRMFAGRVCQESRLKVTWSSAQVGAMELNTGWVALRY